MTRLLIALFLASFSFSLMSYPILFSCSKDGNLKSMAHLDMEDFNKACANLQKDQKDKFLADLCRSYQDCIVEGDRMRKFLGLNIEALQASTVANATLKDPESAEKKLSEEESKTLYGLKEIGEALVSCQKNNYSQRRKSDFFRLYYPFHSNYLYVSGCKSVDNNDSCSMITNLNFQIFLRDALTLGLDPYAVIALGFLENDSSPEGLSLDPIGDMNALGCQTKRAPLKDYSKPNHFTSFGTTYRLVDPIIKNKTFLSDLELLMKNRDEKVVRKKESGYYCAGNLKFDFYKTPPKNFCCVETPYKLESATAAPTSEIEKTGVMKGGRYLTMIALKNHYLRPTKEAARKNRSPEYLLQQYNGFTKQFGITETSAPWRMGVNFYTHPQYGYAGMDMMLNSLMSSPDIGQILDELMKEKGLTELPSILCKEKKGTSFFIDSEYYLKQMKEIPRLEVIKEKYDRRLPFTTGEKRLLDEELKGAQFKENANIFIRKLKSEKEINDEWAHLSFQTEGVISALFGLQNKDVFFEKVIGNNSNSKKLYIKHQGESRKLYEKYLALYKNNPDEFEKNQTTEFYDEINKLSKKSGELWDAVSITIKPGDQDWFLSDALMQPMKEYLAFIKKEFPEKTITKEDEEKVHELSEAQVDLYKRPFIDHDKAVDYYFKNIYPKRKTIGQVSPFSYERLTDEQLEKLIKKIK